MSEVENPQSPGSVGEAKDLAKQFDQEGGNGNGVTSLAPRSMEQAMKFAQLVAASNFVPKDLRGRPGEVLAAIQYGAELGCGPMQALQNIAVINGRPSAFGDLPLGLVRASGLMAWIKETMEKDKAEGLVAICRVQRVGDPEPTERRFSESDAKAAKLWGKQGPWQTYPKRMLQMRARSWALRDVFPDALKGLVQGEEAEDTPAEPRVVGSGSTVRMPGRASEAPEPPCDPSEPEPEISPEEATEPSDSLFPEVVQPTHPDDQGKKK